MLDHISPQAAIDLLLSVNKPLETERVSIYNAAGRVSAEDCIADFPQPSFRKSPFDGYVLSSFNTPGRVKISGEIAAGDRADFKLADGQAYRIFTGAPVPEGADCVVKQEDITLQDGYVIIDNKIRQNTNVIQIGEDYQKGDMLAEKGTLLQFAHLGVLASQGCESINVYKKPIVSVISTGSELVEPGSTGGSNMIYNSSAVAICSWLGDHGAEVRYKGIVKDNADEIKAMVSKCMNDSDVVITTGGASVGDYDFALKTAESLSSEILFWKLKMKPGGAILASQKEGKLLLNLSGNPAAALMCLIVIVRPYLKKVCGRNDVHSRVIKLPLKNPLPKTSSAIRLLRGHIEFIDGKAFFCEHDGRGNGNISSFQMCNAIGAIPPCEHTLDAGDIIDVILF